MSAAPPNARPPAPPAPDPRTTPARPDLAAAHLRGAVVAERYAEPTPAAVTAPAAPLLARPAEEAPALTELLAGEGFAVYERREAWAWGQATLDGYVGWIRAAALGPSAAPTTHRVAVRATHRYPAPDIRARPVVGLSFGARLRVAGRQGGFAVLADGGFVPATHLAPLGATVADWVAEAERFLGTPYLWGGRTAAGLDCSALVQLALQAVGHACPRDSDQQEAALGVTLDEGAALRRGDLVFWRGHVGIMLDAVRLLHANAHHMAVAIEPLAEASARIEAAGGGRPTRRARLDVPTGSG